MGEDQLIFDIGVVAADAEKLEALRLAMSRGLVALAGPTIDPASLKPLPLRSERWKDDVVSILKKGQLALFWSPTAFRWIYAVPDLKHGCTLYQRWPHALIFNTADVDRWFRRNIGMSERLRLLEEKLRHCLSSSEAPRAENEACKK